MKHHAMWKQTLFTGLCISVVSEIYWNLFYDGFRISLSVALFPVLVMTLDRELNSVLVGLTSGGMIFLFRTLIYIAFGDTWSYAIQTALPGGLYYLFYSIVFYLFVKNKYTVKFPRLIISILCCDFLSNLVESMLRNHLILNNFQIFELLTIAVIRTILVGFTLLLIESYRSLLTKKEHEQRYQRLFSMTVELKQETYLMKKNSEEIEEIMSNAYRLYEALSEEPVKPQIKEWALTIARDVHEIKKDYLSIIKGLEQEVNNQYPEKEMRLSDLLIILRELTYQQIESRHLDIRLHFHYKQDFLTPAHYLVMLVLKNLVYNAMEAIESGTKSGNIEIYEQESGENYLFFVRDDGPGIPEKNLAKIFHPGFSTKFDSRGNMHRGVGLSGVESVVKEHLHGTIQVTSVPNIETEFRIEVPVSILKRGIE